jgi:hypothetical protein
VLWIWSKNMRTVDGLGIGSRVADLVAAYGDRAVVDHGVTSDLYTVQGTHGELSFEVADQDPDAGWPADQVGTVVWMMVQSAGSAPVHIANSDGGGACPV